MKDWLASLNQREQLSLLVLGVALALYVLYLLVWSPLDERRDALAQQNAALAQSLTRVDAMASEVIQLRSTGANPGARRNLTALINQSTRQQDLPVSRLQPNSRGEIQVRLESAAFDDLLKWLYDMEFKEGLLVKELSVTQAGAVGRVNATVRVAQAG
ncbi:MAG: type II secretion system protein M [Gammaproteobacteria bacterium]|jgi:type II secretory pathway component PulM|nr:type II secretion system protein M [Gammaproteobacteria bacterium]